MMHRSRLSLALAAFLSLLIVWLLLERRAGLPPAPRPSRSDRLFPPFRPELVTRITLTGRRGALTLERASDPAEGWQLVLPLRPAADRQAVARLLAAVATLGLGDLVSDHIDRHAELGVDEAAATRLRLFAGTRSLVDLFVGRLIDGHTMVRAPRDASVFQAIGDLTGLMALSARAWRDRRVLALDPAAARQIVIDGDAGALRLRRATAAGPWQIFDAPAAAAPAPSADAIARWLAALSTLTAEPLPEEAEASARSALTRPLARIRIGLAPTPTSAPHGAARARELALTLARAPDPGDDGYWLRRDDRPQLYVISAAEALALAGAGIVVPPAGRATSRPGPRPR